MKSFPSSKSPHQILTPVLAALLLLASPALAAEDPPESAPKGAAVTVFKAAKACFSNIVEVSGILIPREETSVRSERPGLKVAEVLAEPGDTVTAGQLLARLSLPEGGLTLVAAPVAGLVSASSAVVGTTAGAKGEALFSIIARSEFDLVGMVPVRDISKLAVNQTARIKIIGTGEVEGKVRRVASTIEEGPTIVPGKVFLGAEDAEYVASVLKGSSDAAAVEATKRGCGMIVNFRRGKGEVFHAGACEWVAGLLRQDEMVMQVTRNVLDRYLGKQG